MGTSNKTTDAAAKDNENVEIPNQGRPAMAEVIDLEEHLPVSLGAKIKKLLKNKKVLAVIGGATAGVLVSVVVINRRGSDAEQIEDESASV